MKVNITGRHCDVPAKIAERTVSLIGKLDKYESRASAADVIYTDETHTKKVEVIVHIDGAPHVAANGSADDFRGALDQVADRAKRLLRDARQKRRDHKAPPLSEGIAPE